MINLKSAFFLLIDVRAYFIVKAAKRFIERYDAKKIRISHSKRKHFLISLFFHLLTPMSNCAPSPRCETYFINKMFTPLFLQLRIFIENELKYSKKSASVSTADEKFIVSRIFGHNPSEYGK